MISCYCLDYNTWVFIPRHVKEDFAEMREMGIDTVCLSFSESDMSYARRTFEHLVELAHEAGLKVFVIPSRIAGRFAGAPLMPSVWLARNPQYAIPYWLPIGCLECQEVRDFIKDFVHSVIRDYAVDGIVWDEPKGIPQISHHPATIARFGESPTKENMVDSFCEFFADLVKSCHELTPSLIQTLFCQATEEPAITGRLAKTPYLNYFGYDGNLSKQRVFHEPMAETKYRIEECWDRTVRECEEANIGTFALVESMCMPREEHDNFERNFDNYLTRCKPDHLSVYYYAHNADDPEGLNDIIRRIMKKHFVKR